MGGNSKRRKEAKLRLLGERAGARAGVEVAGPAAGEFCPFMSGPVVIGQEAGAAPAGMYVPPGARVVNVNVQTMTTPCMGPRCRFFNGESLADGECAFETLLDEVLGGEEDTGGKTDEGTVQHQDPGGDGAGAGDAGAPHQRAVAGDLGGDDPVGGPPA